MFERGQNIVENHRGGRSAPTTVNSSVRTREYLTTAEIERLMAAARKSSRYGHRDATMILIGYRHGLRASELCDLQWSQVELATGRLHVRRAKNGSPSVHPMKVGERARSGGMTAPPPPAEKATASGEQAWQSCTDDGTGHCQESPNLAAWERCTMDV